MGYLLDTSVAILLRDRDERALAKVEELAPPAFISVITRVELEGGVYREPRLSAIRRFTLDVLLQTLSVLPFEDSAARAYSDIVASAGYSRRKLVDRMIAAQALVAGATLVTLNPQDFTDVPGLKMLAW